MNYNLANTMIRFIQNYFPSENKVKQGDDDGDLQVKSCEIASCRRVQKRAALNPTALVDSAHFVQQKPLHWLSTYTEPVTSRPAIMTFSLRGTRSLQTTGL
jgi:hypothetical protein